jgi:sorbitol-specific phosphotransferase system component IIC
MSTDQKDNEEEVDLGYLFVIIGKGFSNLFNFIGNFFKGLFHGIISILIFL